VRELAPQVPLAIVSVFESAADRGKASRKLVADTERALGEGIAARAVLTLVVAADEGVERVERCPAFLSRGPRAARRFAARPGRSTIALPGPPCHRAKLAPAPCDDEHFAYGRDVTLLPIAYRYLAGCVGSLI
jgi:hypothetical protein